MSSWFLSPTPGRNVKLPSAAMVAVPTARRGDGLGDRADRVREGLVLVGVIVRQDVSCEHDVRAARRPTDRCQRVPDGARVRYRHRANGGSFTSLTVISRTLSKEHARRAVVGRRGRRSRMRCRPRNRGAPVKSCSVAARDRHCAVERERAAAASGAEGEGECLTGVRMVPVSPPINVPDGWFSSSGPVFETAVMSVGAWFGDATCPCRSA